MTDETLASMRVMLADSGDGGRIDVPLDSFMKFDQEISRDLERLESRWQFLSTNASLWADLKLDR